jgi:DNA-binding response OmpR family regulator
MDGSSANSAQVDPGAATTILVVEDDSAIRATLAKALAASGYRVLTASDGGEARALFAEVKPDLIVLDLMLPDDDGLALAASFQTLTTAPILICSARDGQLDRVLSSRLGAVDFVAKPFDLEDLENRVKAALCRSPQPGGPLATDSILVWRQHHSPQGGTSMTEFLDAKF